MLIQMNVVLEAAVATCEKCKRPNLPCLRVNLFVKEQLAETKPICWRCFGENQEFSDRVELEEPDVEVGVRKTLKKQKKVSREQEIDIAEELNARVQVNSGAVSGSKGDVRKKGVARVEAKFTAAASFPLKLEELEKIAGECEGKEKPVFVIDFREPLTNRLKDRYAVVPFDDLKELLNAHDSR